MKKWIQEAIPKSHKGRLKEKLGVPKDEKIPAKKLEKAEHSKSPVMRREANLARTLRKLRK